MEHEAQRHPLAIFNEVGARHVSLLANDELILEEYVAEALELHDAGLLLIDFPDYRELKRDHLIRLARNRSNGMGTQIKNQLLAGGLAQLLDFGTEFNEMVTICNAATLNSFYGAETFQAGRKVPLGAIVSEDMLLMREQLRIVTAKNNAQWDRLDPAYSAAASELKPFASYLDLWRNGGGLEVTA